MVNFSVLSEKQIRKEVYDLRMNGVENYAHINRGRKDDLPGYNIISVTDLLNFLTVNDYMNGIANKYNFKIFNNSLPLSVIYFFPTVFFKAKEHEEMMLKRLEAVDYHCPVCRERYELKDFYSFPLFKFNITVFEKDLNKKSGEELIDLFAVINLSEISPICYKCLSFAHPELIDIINDEKLSIDVGREHFKNIHKDNPDAIENLLLYETLVDYKRILLDKINFFLNPDVYIDFVDFTNLEKIGDSYRYTSFSEMLDNLLK